MAQLTTVPGVVLEKALGKKVMAQMLATASDGAAWLRARQTTMEALKDLVDNVPPVDEEEFEEFAAPRMKRFSEILRRSLAANPILQAPTPASLMRFLVQHARHVDVARLETLKFDGIVHVLVPASVVPSMVLNPRNLFEPSVQEAGRHLRDSIERWYKALLAFLVELTLVAHQQPRPSALGQHPTLGPWMKTARALWDSFGGPVGILETDLRTVRNFFSHEDLDLDVRAETVRSPLDATQVLDREGFARLLHEQFFKLSAMWFALLAWLHGRELNAGGRG